MHLYELALAEGETSRDLMARARKIGLGTVTATTVISEEQARRLCPQRAARIGEASASGSGSPGADADTRARTGPSMGVVAATIVAALALLSVGISVLGGTSAAAEGPRPAAAAEDTDEADAPAEDAATDSTLPPVETALVVVDPQPLCAGWPPVAEYWSGFKVAMAAATDPEEVASWAAEHQSGAEMGLRDELAAAFDETGQATVLAVLDWVYDIAFPSVPMDLADVRIATDEIAPYVASLRSAAGGAC